jgi:hypothetical protein
MKMNTSNEGMKVTELPDDYRDEPRVAVRSELVIDVHVIAKGKGIEARCTSLEKGDKKKVFENGWIHYGSKEPVLFTFVLHAGKGIRELAFMKQRPIVAGNPSSSFGNCAETHDRNVFDDPDWISESKASVAFRPGKSDEDRAYVLNVCVKLEDSAKEFRYALDPRIINKTAQRRPGPAYP